MKTGRKGGGGISFLELIRSAIIVVVLIVLIVQIIGVALRLGGYSAEGGAVDGGCSGLG